jgi:hypothetical protein
MSTVSTSFAATIGASVGSRAFVTTDSSGGLDAQATKNSAGKDAENLRSVPTRWQSSMAGA